MRLNKLSSKDKEIFAKYLNLSRHELSIYAFENIYTWRGLFDIYWALINDSLCVFFKDKIGCFMYVPAQGKLVTPKVIEESFMIMDKFNKNKNISRIENIEQKELSFYQRLGYECVQKYPEYLCRRTDLSQLRGDSFKSKRACLNYFIKHYEFEYLPFSLKDNGACLELYNRWKEGRKTHNQDSIYQGMLEDASVALKELLDGYRYLSVLGRVVKIGGKIKAFTFGSKLNRDTFCILYEVTDLSVKGLAQFIFWKFSAELEDYSYINIMDDSGLENLKRVKLSYQPLRLIPAYIARRQNE